MKIYKRDAFFLPLRVEWRAVCRHGLSPDLTMNYPLLATRKFAPTVAGDRRAKSDAPGVSIGGGGDTSQ